jgi:tetratricopeptide (TPR) repeat protein
VAKKNKARARGARPPDRRLDAALDQVHSLMASRRWGEAHALLLDLDRAYPQHQDILRYLVEAAMHLDDAHTYQYGCERLHGLCPDDRDLPYMLARAYVKNGWLALALAMSQRALAHDPANEKAEDTRGLVAELEPLVDQQVTLVGLAGADGLECLTMHDQVRSFLAQGRYARAREVAAQLAQRRPQFPPAYNNGAEACFHDGRLAQAIDLEQRLLTFDPDNVHALANLVRFLSVSGKGEDARGYAERLKKLKPLSKDHAAKQAEALAWLGDDAGVLAVFEQGRSLAGAEGPEDDATLYHLAAVAAYRLGREEEAHGYWHSALGAVPHFELARGNLEDLQRPVGERNAPWSYPFNYYVPRKLIEGLLAQVAPARGKDRDEAVEREAQQYLQAHPELEGLVSLLLDRGDGPGRELALGLAGLFRTPAMLQAVRDFARGQRGANQLRTQAAHLAGGAGLPPGSPPRLRVGGAGEGTGRGFEIHADPVGRPLAPAVIDLVNQGMSALGRGDAARGERLLRKALAIAPDDPVVMNNLAVACAQLGRPDEAEALSIRLHERHPDYLFGRTALASLAAERGRLDRARELLEPLRRRQRLHVAELISLCMAEINLHIAEGDWPEAQRWLGMWREATPDHPSLALFEARFPRLR